MTCCDCGYAYHVGGCSDVSKTTFKTKENAYRKAWRCSTRRSARTRGGGSHNDKGKKDQPLDIRCCKPSPVHQLVDNLMFPRKTVNGIELRVQIMSEKYYEVLARLSQQDSDMKNLRRGGERIE